MTKPNSNPTSDEIFNFPCDYPVKIFGKDCKDFHPAICRIIEKHTGALDSKQISIKRSSKGNYVCFTVAIIATSRTQLDAINADLQACDLVAYIL